MIKNFKIWQKFALITIALSIPIAVLLYLLVAEKNIAIDFTRQEVVGNTYLRPLRKLQEYVQNHERVTGGSANSAIAAGSAARIDETLKEIDNLDRQLGKELKTSAKLNELKVKWQGLNSVEARANLEERTQFYEDVIADMHSLALQVANSSNLILDSDLDSYYLMDSVIVRLPESQDILGKTWNLGQGIISRGAVTAEEKSQMIVWTGELHTNLEEVDVGLTTAFANNPAGNLKPLIDSQFQSHVAATNAFADLIEKRIITPTTMDLKREEFDAAGASAVNASYQLWDLVSVTLDGLLETRVSGLNGRKYTTLAAVLLVVIFTILLAVFIVRSVTRPLSEAVNFANRLAKGDLSAEIIWRRQLTRPGSCFKQ